MKQIRQKMQQVVQSMTFRQAVQAALAVGLSIYFGSLVSGRRWYWAAIAAFIVGIGVGSRGESLTKGLQRVGGTVLGLVVGIFLASAVVGDNFLSIGLTLFCIFMAFYAFQQAYGLMIFWITLMLALLYGMLGMFQPSLLVLRLEETAIGAAISIVVTMFVLPTPSRDALRGAAKGFLTSLSDLVKQAANETREKRLAAARDVQSKAQALRSAIGPLKRGWAPLSPPTHLRAAHVGMYCAFVARELAHRGGTSEAERSTLLAEIEKMTARLDESGDHGEKPEHQDGAGAGAMEHAGTVPRALWDALCRFEQALQDV